MGYPIAYRRAARKYGGGGFQRPAPSREVRPPRPDNDNNPPVNKPGPPRPDNDNDPNWTFPDQWVDKQGGRWDHPRFPKLPEWPGYLPALADAGMDRILPPYARVAWDIVKFGANWNYQDYSGTPEVKVPPNWVVGCGPVTPPLAYNLKWAFFNTGTPTVCGLTLQALSGENPIPRWNWDECLLAKAVALTGGNKRWANVQYWSNPTRANVPGEVHWPVKPNIFPNAVPEPIPWEVANPIPAYVPAPVGNEMPASKSMPATAPRGRPAYAPVRFNRANRPGARPQVGEVTVPTVVVNPPTVTNPVRKPPGPGVKERKIRAVGSFAFMNAALHAASGIYEDAKFANDLVNAFYNALPGKHNAKTPQDKLLAIYRNYDKVDIGKAVEGVLWAVAGEKAGSYIDRARGTAAENLGLSMNITIPTGSAPRI